MDIRDIQLPEPDQSILANVRDPNQRALLETAMQSHAYRTAEILARHDELEREARRLEAIAAEGERRIEENARLREKLASAEHARNAAERVAEKERGLRLSVEEELDR